MRRIAALVCVVAAASGCADRPKRTAAADAAPPSTRHVEGAFTRGAAATHRPYAPPRGDASRPRLSAARLRELEDGGRHVEAAGLLALEGDAALALRVLDAAPGRDGADVAIARAALLVHVGRAAEALTFADAALAAAPTEPAAHWNRALALRDLGLEMAAAGAFEQVAASGAPGWSEEAGARAHALTDAVKQRAAHYDAMLAAGAVLVEHGTVPPPELTSAVPGLAVLYFLDAVRARGDAAGLDALQPLAAALDAQLAATPVELVATLARVRATVTPRRMSLAAAYLAWPLGRVTARSPARAADRLVRDALAVGADDIALGTLVLSGLGGQRPEQLLALADAAGSRWFPLLARTELAKAAMAAGDRAGAERRLREVAAECAGAPLPHRCVAATRELALLLDDQGRPDEAVALAEAGLHAARREGHYGYELSFLELLVRASAERETAHTSRLNAYVEELVARPLVDDRARQARVCWGRLMQAGAMTLRAHVAPARAVFATLEACPPSLTRAHLLADLAWLTGEPRDARAALEMLAAAPAEASGDAAQRLYVEARARARGEPGEARALLGRLLGGLDPRAPAPAHAAGTDVDASLRAVAHLFAAMLAADEGDAGAALGWLAAELDVTLPPTCVLGVAVDHDRLLVAGRDARGEARVAVSRLPVAWRVASADIVSAGWRGALAACPEVRVLARPPLVGAPGLLPRELAWSYVAAGAPAARPAAAPSGTTLLVTDVAIPPELGLAALAPARLADAAATDAAPATVRLSGREATPTRVLAAMRDAGWIELHTHGIADTSADAAYLVLAADAGGGHALTASAIRALALRAAPVVVLAACRAGREADTLEAAWGLPAAFLAAGASAVVATPEPLPDRDATAFFAALRARVTAGASLPVALRDERLARGAGWADDLVIFSAQ